MPFKTQYGSHYHMTEGCHGATIPCGTEGLTPCADCCGGTGGNDGHGGPAGMAGGSPAAGTGDDGGHAGAGQDANRAVPDMQEIVMRACDDGDTVVMADGRTIAFREAWETGLASDGYVLETALEGIPLRLVTPGDLAEAADQLADGRAGLGSGDGWEGYRDQGRTLAPADDVEARRGALREALRSATEATGIGGDGSSLMSVLESIAPDALSSLDGMGFGNGAADMGGLPVSAPTPPMPRNLGHGTYIDADGTIVRDGSGTRGETALREAASRMVRRLDNAAPARWPSPDYAERARHALLARIESEQGDLPDGADREAFRRSAQQVWNTMHPEAPVLEWSRDDEGYVSDSGQAVVMRRRNYDEMRDFNHGSNAIGYDYLVMDKETGECANDRIHHADLAVRQVERRIGDIEQDMRARANAEIARQQNGLYGEWLEERRRQSDAWRYHAGAGSLSAGRALWDEFVEDTGYVRPSPDPRPTDEEREQLAGLYQRQRDARAALDDVMLRYGVDDEVVRLIRPQYSPGGRSYGRERDPLA